MPATISSTFRIVLDQTLTAAVAGLPFAAQITLPRACRVVAFYVTAPGPLAASRWSLTNTTQATEIIAVGSPIGGAGDILDDRPIAILVANQECASGDVIQVDAVVGTASRFVIECEASNPQTLTVT
jgi:hypothetical protein